MDGILTFSTENCFICSEFMASFKNDLTVVTGYSEIPIFQLIESFTNTEFTKEVVEEAGICQNCFIKFNEYDEHRSIADQIQADLISLFEASNDSSHLVGKIKEEVGEFEEDSLVYETVEEAQREPIEEMFVESQDGEGAETDAGHVIVEYDWSDPKPDLSESKTKFVRPRTSKYTETFGTIIQLEDNQKVYQCEICMRTFKEKSKLKSHREIHTTERNVICPICGKAFKTQACLRSHRRVHNPVYMYCDICGKSYTQKPELTKHIKFVHYHIREFFCESCGAGFGSKGHLSTHMLTHQDQSAKTVVCQVCSLAFYTRAKLERHMKSHTKERNYECALCNKKFLYSYNVTAHIKHVHYREKRKENEKNCSFCGKKFQKQWKLREHLAEIHQVVETTAIEAMYE